MKKIVILMVVAIFSMSSLFANARVIKEKKTAEEVFAFAQSMPEFNADAFLIQANELNLVQKAKLIDLAIADVKRCEQTNEAPIGEYILAVLIPPLAVGLHTDWDAKPTISNLLWTCLGYVPGVIHAFIVLGR